MFERFTRDARTAVHLAVEDGGRHGGTVDSTALLLALSWPSADADAGRAGAVLRAAGLDRTRLEAAAATVAPSPGATAPGTTEPSPAAQAAAPSGPRTDPDLDADALAALGIDLDAIRARADEVFGPGSLDVPTPSERRRARAVRGRLTPDAKKVLELALREAVRLHDREITSAHLLLGVLRDTGSPACRTLVAAGADLDTLRGAAEAARAADAA